MKKKRGGRGREKEKKRIRRCRIGPKAAPFVCPFVPLIFFNPQRKMECQLPFAEPCQAKKEPCLALRVWNSFSCDGGVDLRTNWNLGLMGSCEDQ